MTDKLLRKDDIAAMLGTSPSVAASVLARYGCHSIDLGRGKSRGKRWLESAVRNTLQKMQLDANTGPPPKACHNKKNSKATHQSNLSVANMSVNQLEQLIQNMHLPKGAVVQ